MRAWRYSIRWGLPHITCPGPEVLGSVDVEPGQPCPADLAALTKPGAGYVISLDFQLPDAPMRRWSKEAKGRVRRNNLVKRLQRQVPLFADEIYARETTRRPAYYAGENYSGGSDHEQ
ncbi:theronine dehydrogenase [Aquabacterium soli]|uniref:Theronine dehydrogenase n=1 Tax=Aquabacterium soli TaxID=2493092 RepID=A0A3R8T206_9BURK|nr:theronine dehydrogenase [Aquabacterium soli]